MWDNKRHRGCRGAPLHKCLILLMTAIALISVTVAAVAQDIVVPDDAVSREFTVYNADDISAVAPGDAISREFTVYNANDLEGVAPDDAISREFTVNNVEPPPAPDDAISREFTVWNDLDKPQVEDAISREFTIVNRYLIDFKVKPDGESVVIQGTDGLGVTAVFADCIYVANPLRYTSIKVVGGTAAVGQRVSILGAMATDWDGNRYIANATVTPIGTLNIAPYAITTVAAYCGDAGWNSETGAGQRGVTDGSGACLIGIYVKMSGKIADGPTGGLIIDDGSGKTVMLSPEEGSVGLSVGSVEVVNGVLTLKKIGAQYLPLIRVTGLPEEAVSIPGTPTGNASPISGVSETYTTTGATCNAEGHSVEYSFNWGDGASSPWSASPSASHSWSAGGAKTVTVTARCQVHPSVSATSAGLAVNVVDANPPVISNLIVVAASSTAVVTWTTDKPSTSQVDYGPDSNYGLSSGLNGNLVTSHSVVLSGLISGATYHYQVKSTDAGGHQGSSPDGTFTSRSAIPYGNDVTVDGNLSEWASASWHSLDTIYDSSPVDIAGGAWAAKWTAGKVYLAVKVQDTAHVFKDSYGQWGTWDGVEMYIHTTGSGGDYLRYQEPAQEWAVGMKTSIDGSVWSTVGDSTHYGGYTPTASQFVVAGSIVGDWLYYEAAITPFQYFGGRRGAADIVSPLSEGMIIGLDVTAVSNDGVSPHYDIAGYAGMKCSNLGQQIGGWAWTIPHNFAQHELAPQPAEVVSVPGTPTGNASPAVNVSETYSTAVSACNWGHTVEYSFNWGDGTSSPWSASTSASHSWSASGAKTVTVTARCQVHTSVSATSAGFAVNVTASVTPVEMIYIPAGSFLMGNSGVGNDAAYSQSSELPQHSVSLSGYYIGKYEVTRGEYRAFMTAGGYTTQSYWSAAGWSWKVSNGRTEPYHWVAYQDWYGGQPFTQSDNHPVVGVSYYEAEAFCNWAGGHLPTEAQWEKAARWTGSHANVYPWGDVWDAEKCNNISDSNAAGGGYGRYQTAPVGSYPSGASPCGCQDIAGNVWEWCADWYGSTYYSTSPSSDPPGPTSGSYRVLRGGGWTSSALFYRCASRASSDPDYYGLGGFRLAR